MDHDEDPALAETQSPALVARPAGDARARDVARAKIANALFATEQQVKLGRYHLLERVGEGGMGVVWGAYDPELERRVAIKLVHAKASASRERILLEGQALAKLSHPNVVTVHDVGVVDDEVYLVMEWIRGHNLRRHCATPRTVRELVALYRAAGEGLSAAHRAGLVHRDFKPENVMVGDDGRVRVLDFGLALDRVDGDDGAVAGTPRYMAPEQQRGEVSEAVDQYAFGVALREALVARNADKREAPVPGWLAAIAARATQAKPEGRYASFDELLRALSRDPTTVWRRRLLVGGAVAAAAGAFAIGTLRAGNDEVAPCTGAADELASVWNAEKRAHMLDHVRALGPYGADEAARLDARLAAYGQGWVAKHRDACKAHRRGELTPHLYERGLACLARARVALDTVVDVVSRAPVERFPDALVAAHGLPDVDRCTIDEGTVEPPPAALAPLVDATANLLARASVLVLAADSQADHVARTAAVQAEQLRYAPTIARAQLVLGRALLVERGTEVDALLAFERAANTALGAGDDVMFVEAFARALYVYSQTPKDKMPGNVANLAASLRYVQQIAERTRDAGAFARTLLYANAGTERFTSGDVAAARDWYRKAYAETGSQVRDVELLAIIGNLASTAESREERDRLFHEQRTHLERELGPNHAFTLQERLRAAMVAENAERATAQLREVCAALRTWYPHYKTKIDQCFYELGWLADERGDREGARTAMASVGDSPDERVPLARAYSILFRGDAAEAARVASKLATDASQRPAWWEQFYAVDAWVIEATARLVLDERAIAADVLSRALRQLEQPSPVSGATFYQRRLARVRAMLATLSSGRRARELADQAIAWYRSAGGYDEIVVKLDAIRAGSR